MSYPASIVCCIENSVSINWVDETVVDAMTEDVSFTALFGVRNVVFSFVTPPATTAISVVLPPSLRLHLILGDVNELG